RSQRSDAGRPSGSRIRGASALKTVRALEDVACALASDDAWRHRVARRYTREDRGVRDGEAVDPAYAQPAVDDRQRVAPHLRSASRMPLRQDRIADKVFQFSAAEAARQYLRAGKIFHRWRVADLTSEREAFYRRCHIRRFMQEAGVYLHIVAGA